MRVAAVQTRGNLPRPVIEGIMLLPLRTPSISESPPSWFARAHECTARPVISKCLDIGRQRFTGPFNARGALRKRGSPCHDGPIAILSQLRPKRGSGHGEHTFKNHSSFNRLSSAYSANRYNLPLYWLSTAFGTAGWNVASSLIAVGLVRVP